MWITFLLGGCRIIQITNNRTSTNTNAPNKRNKSESRTTCEREVTWYQFRNWERASGLELNENRKLCTHYWGQSTLKVRSLRLHMRTFHLLCLLLTFGLWSGSLCAKDSRAKRRPKRICFFFYLSNFLDIGENLMNSPSLGEHCTKSYRESQRQQAKSCLWRE